LADFGRLQAANPLAPTNLFQSANQSKRSVVSRRRRGSGFGTPAESTGLPKPEISARGWDAAQAPQHPDGSGPLAPTIPQFFQPLAFS
jgi:hypothetical protein